MVQVLKVYAPTPAQSIAATRGMPVSKIASLDASIDQPSASNFKSFEPEFALRDDTPQDAGSKNTPRHNLPQHGGRLVMGSQWFTSLIDHMQKPTANDQDPSVKARQMGERVSRAIRIYENNAKVISGNPEVTGTKISIRM